MLKQRVDNLNKQNHRKLERSIYVVLALHILSKMSSMGHNQQLKEIEVDRHQELVMDHGSDAKVIYVRLLEVGIVGALALTRYW